MQTWMGRAERAAYGQCRRVSSIGSEHERGMQTWIGRPERLRAIDVANPSVEQANRLARRLLHRCCKTSAARRTGLVGLERLLTVKEAAERLLDCTATVYGLCKSGKLGHVRVGNSIRVHEAELGRLDR